MTVVIKPVVEVWIEVYTGLAKRRSYLAGIVRHCVDRESMQLTVV